MPHLHLEYQHVLSHTEGYLLLTNTLVSQPDNRGLAALQLTASVAQHALLIVVGLFGRNTAIGTVAGYIRRCQFP